jgi:APA family basic amino acid/polyamine antiporter
MLSRLLAIKNVESNAESSHLKRVLGPFELTMLGIGAIIGTGIFVLTGTAAAGGDNHIGAGPALVISFLITAVACGLAALCYAEFASMIPVSGSAYTYAYASFGELVAWIIGWDLILEYAVGNIAIAIGWSGYMLNLLQFFNIHPPAWLCIDPMTASHAIAHAADANPQTLELAKQAYATAPNLGFPLIINLPAVLVVLLVSTLLYFGVKESARFNSVLVLIKLAMIALFLVAGLPHVDFATHWQPFAPNGFSGIMTGAAIIFFAYIGFDAVSTTAEEAKNPQRDLPIGMIGSLLICTVLYIAVAIVLTGMAPLSVLKSPKPVAAALNAVNATGIANIISLGAVLSITSVLVVMQFGQTRIFYAMSRDGLLPKVLSKVHPKFKTPHVCTLLTGILVAIPAGLIDIGVAAEVSNIGTLFAFILVAVGIMILRVRDPQKSRGFKTPLVWIVAPGCVITCFALMYYLTPITWIRFGIWMVIGLVFYFVYGYRNSELAKQEMAKVA